MVRSRHSHSEHFQKSSSSSDTESENSSSELVPRSVSFTTWDRLPPTRAIPVDSAHRKWVTDCNPPLRPFQRAPLSGDDFFKDSLTSQVVRCEEALLFYTVPDTPTHLVAPSLLHSRLRSQEFPWSAILFSTRSTFTGCWADWVDHVFANDAPFVDVLHKVGIADAIKLSPRLGVFRKVDDLEYLVQRWSHTTHTFYTSWGEFTPTLEDVHVLLKLPVFGDYDISSSPVGSHLIDMAKELKATTVESARYSREFLAKRRAAPVPSDPPKKVRGTGNVLPPERSKNMRESFKYTFATWVRYFFGDYDAGRNFHSGPVISQPLKRAAFIAFWLSKYVFLGPPWESVSSGGLYGRLDQIQDQMFSSFGCFPINSFMDLVFLQYFLYERFPEYAPVRTVPDHVLDGATRPLEPRVWGWTMGRPRQLLSEILDEEAQFVHRPYTINLFPGVEPLSHIYCPGAFSSRNLRLVRCEGVFDLWKLFLHPQFLPGFLITDNVSAAGGAFWPFAYRPDRVCRQFGLDHAPCNVDLEFRDVSESMKAVLFKSTDALPTFDAVKFIPSDRVGRVLDIWVSYFHHLKSSVKRYEGHDSLQVFPDVQIMYKNPYFVTTFTRKIEKTEGNLSKKRKEPFSKKSQGKKAGGLPRKRKVPIAGTRASERLKAKPSHKATTQGSSAGPNAEEETAESPNSDHDVDVDGYVPDSVSKECVNSPTCVEVIDSAPPVDVTPLEVIDSVPPIDATSLESALPSPVITPPVGASGEKEPIVVVPLLASLLSSDVAMALSEFSARHAGFLLPEDILPHAFLRPAYTFFAEFLHFVRSHSVMELLSSYRDKVMEDLKALSLFGFKGEWFEALSRRFDHNVPPAALEDLGKIIEAASGVELRNDELKYEIKRLQLELVQGEAELARLNVRRAEIEGARIGLDVLFDF
ncbi:Aminotransferase-like, plant mobile domain [Sesbania bispinosa]|nr:Aminotransferase-like, plant mobile domain [Sesbania bispinosa]